MDEKSILAGLVSRLGQHGAALQIGTTQASVSRWLSGKHQISPGMKKLIRLAGGTDEANLERTDKP